MLINTANIATVTEPLEYHKDKENGFKIGHPSVTIELINKKSITVFFEEMREAYSFYNKIPNVGFIYVDFSFNQRIFNSE